ncbi:hypothetical protein BWI15_16615 [Kribbella sp. ALI-6-A]|nr:hypothetical protein BWI15_16615 [Kribbella sp. ALI-6-A]
MLGSGPTDRSTADAIAARPTKPINEALIMPGGPPTSRLSRTRNVSAPLPRAPMARALVRCANLRCRRLIASGERIAPPVRNRLRTQRTIPAATTSATRTPITVKTVVRVCDM